MTGSFFRMLVRWCAALLSALATLSFLASSAQAEHRVALLIGNAAYSHGETLTSPSHDIRAVSTTLTRHGFRTTVATDLDSDDLHQVIESFTSSAPINGTAFVYFSGRVGTGKSFDGSKTPLLLSVDDPARGMELTRLVDWVSLHTATTRNIIIVDDRAAKLSSSTNQGSVDGGAGRSMIKLEVPDIWLGYASGSTHDTGSDGHDLSRFASAVSQSAEPNLEKLLSDECDSKASTCGRPLFPEAASVAVASPEKLPTAAHAGDEWIAPDGTVYCWCPPGEVEGFWAGKYEVPLSKWKIPGRFEGVGATRNHPTTQLKYADVLDRLRSLTVTERKAGRLPADWEYALPSPEQWEHAARAGTTSDRYFVADDLPKHANFADRSLFDTRDATYLYADQRLNDGYARLAPVGRYLANPWGLHDVYGNVWEATDGGVLCGGSWVSLPNYCLASLRKPVVISPTDYVGLRLVIRSVTSR